VSEESGQEERKYYGESSTYRVDDPHRFRGDKFFHIGRTTIGGHQCLKGEDD
jgi:hypothetical protein